LPRNRFRTDIGRRFSRDYSGSAQRTGSEILFRDEFSTAIAAAIASPKAMDPPGPFTWTVSGTTHSVSGGNYVFASNAGNEGLRETTAIVRAGNEGLAFVALGLNVSAITSGVDIGWRIAASMGVSQAPGIRFFGTGPVWQAINASGNVAVLDGTPATGTAYDLAVVLRPLGGFILRKLSTASVWTLLFVEDIASTASVYPQIRHTTTVGVLGSARCVTNWAIPRTYFSASGTIGTVNVNAADIVATMRCVGTGTQGIQFRVQDAQNYWLAERAATTLRIHEVVAGVSTQRATAAITAVTGDRLCVVADSTNYLRAYVSPADGSAIVTVTYATATNFATATGMAVVDEANYTNLEVFNRLQSGLRLTE
jgi:hypothetical protein